MYLLFADESGTHGGSHAFVVGGIAVHEHDAQNLQKSLASVVEPYVPLFADSRASRLIQTADLVSYALYRHYDPGRKNRDYVDGLWDVFDSDSGAMHGVVHYTPSFGSGSCQCKPCQSRLLIEAAKSAVESSVRR